MDPHSISQAMVIGIAEGITEFLPISSTGHIIVLADLLGFQGPPGKVFEVFIQLGAILAVVWSYRQRLWRDVVAVRTEARSRYFLANMVIGFMPAAIVGLISHDFIKAKLFYPEVVALALLIGGVVILLVEAKKPPAQHHEAETLPWRIAFAIGCFQIAALIPGVSRSGATIMGAMLVGVDRKAATEFSFFLSIPTITAAALYDLWKGAGSLSINDIDIMAIGFVSSFISALFVIHILIDFVSRRGFAPFGWYRIIAGGIMLYLLYTGVYHSGVL